jgi:prepilin-type N-terminal cleavage/methylation domain-containing protein/prepilin-type processing-associated H-X9-DG protein
MSKRHFRPMNRQLARRNTGMNAGFTLVELLVVIGIIAVLIAILLPTLNKAREASRQVKCLANMRSITQAMIGFANDHKGFMPGRAGSGHTRYTTSGGVVNGNPPNGVIEAADWICWHRKVDPITGTANSGASDGNITYSSIAPYMGVKPIDTTGDPVRANSVAQQLENVFRCPSDQLDARPNADQGGRGAYRYSYSANEFWTNHIRGAVGYPANARYGGTTFTGKITSIKVPSEKILLVCEDEFTIDDGIFVPNPHNWDLARVNMVAARHTLKPAGARNTNAANPWTLNQDARGNVSFCDGHAEWFSRKDALRAKYSGRPDPDPVGY